MLFSYARAYFLVDMPVPSAYVQFLRTLMPRKPRAEIYSAVGLHKQGKNSFYRDLLHHLRHSSDKFRIAPGIKGTVMLVFDLPSFPYVFKLIKDFYPAHKKTTREQIKGKYQLVKRHDRVGRMADTLDYSKVALPLARFEPELIDEMQRFCASMLEITGSSGAQEIIVIEHAYIERRMIPLNLLLKDATAAGDDEAIERATIEYGNAIKDLVAANIFPGDMLWKNFGMTRQGKVVFYDYDEIEYLSDCNFRHVPPPRGGRGNGRKRSLVRRWSEGCLPQDLRPLPARQRTRSPSVPEASPRAARPRLLEPAQAAHPGRRHARRVSLRTAAPLRQSAAQRRSKT